MCTIDDLWMNEMQLKYIMGFMVCNWEFVAIGTNFIAFGENYISFPQGSKTSFLYLIEGSDKIHGSSIGSTYESMIMYSRHPLLQFYNLSEFLYIWEAIPAITREGFEPQNC